MIRLVIAWIVEYGLKALEVWVVVGGFAELILCTVDRVRRIIRAFRTWRTPPPDDPFDYPPFDYLASSA